MLIPLQLNLGVPGVAVPEAAAVIRGVVYDCDCLDWSQTLFRRKIRRNFTNMSVQNIMDSILDNELSGETITIGTIDSQVTVPLVDARQARVFDVCRDLAGATGQTFYMDFDETLQMRSTTIPSAPLILNEDNVLFEGTTVTTDRETYRNVQTVLVTGTPQVENEEAMTLMSERLNEEEIADRAAIEGGTGRYEEYEEITHPTSNRLDDLQFLGVGFANLRLATSGLLRTIMACRVRGYGFRAGQLVTVNLPNFGVLGNFIIQRVTISEVGGQFLFHDLELTASSRQWRAYESWIAILSNSKISIQLFGALVHDSVTFSTPGLSNWTVPNGITTVTVTVKGASGGGSGGARRYVYQTRDFPNCIEAGDSWGGTGGKSGKAIASLLVTEGDVLTVFIGTRGIGGSGGKLDLYFGPACGGPPIPKAGTAGTASTVFRNGVSIAEGFGGGGGNPDPPSQGTAGGGSGSIVTVGGGKSGGNGGFGQVTGSAGQHGEVMIEW
jgi:hypothetical protein